MSGAARRGEGTSLPEGHVIYAGMRFVLLTVLLLCASCGSDTVTPTAQHVAPAYPHVSSETAARYAKGLAKGAWTELELVSKEEAFANIHSHLQAFSDMTGCSVVASRRRQFSRIEYADFVAATYRNVIAGVKCS
jgi:hypothetical protein